MSKEKNKTQSKRIAEKFIKLKPEEKAFISGYIMAKEQCNEKDKKVG